MKTHATALVAMFAAGLVALAPAPAAACGSDFVLGDEVGAAHPASIGVAFAMNDALAGGLLAPTSSADGAASRLQADDAAHMLEQRLASVRSRLPATSLLLVESRLWTRYVPAGQRKADVHADHDAGPPRAMLWWSRENRCYGACWKAGSPGNRHRIVGW